MSLCSSEHGLSFFGAFYSFVPALKFKYAQY